MKGTICSYKDTLVFTFSSILADTMIQRSFFKKLVNDGVEVTIETNGSIMTKCMKCGVYIADNTDKCPLCQQVVAPVELSSDNHQGTEGVLNSIMMCRISA